MILCGRYSCDSVSACFAWLQWLFGEAQTKPIGASCHTLLLVATSSAKAFLREDNLACCVNSNSNGLGLRYLFLSSCTAYLWCGNMLELESFPYKRESWNPLLPWSFITWIHYLSGHASKSIFPQDSGEKVALGIGWGGILSTLSEALIDISDIVGVK